MFSSLYFFKSGVEFIFLLVKVIVVNERPAIASNSSDQNP